MGTQGQVNSEIMNVLHFDMFHYCYEVCVTQSRWLVVVHKDDLDYPCE